MFVSVFACTYTHTSTILVSMKLLMLLLLHAVFAGATAVRVLAFEMKLLPPSFSPTQPSRRRCDRSRYQNHQRTQATLFRTHSIGDEKHINISVCLVALHSHADRCNAHSLLLLPTPMVVLCSRFDDRVAPPARPFSAAARNFFASKHIIRMGVFSSLSGGPSSCSTPVRQRLPLARR